MNISSTREAISLFTVLFALAIIFVVLIFGIIPGQTTTQDFNLSFDGVDDYVTFENSDSIDIDGSFTVSTWVKPDGLKDNRQTILGGGDVRVGIEISENNRWQLFFNGDGSQQTVESESVVRRSEWTHLAGRYLNSSGEVSLWVDGTKQDNTTSDGIASKNDEMALGYNTETGSEYFDGGIDNLRIYSRYLSDDEINTLYNRGPVENSALVGYWKFDKAQNQTVYDYSDYSNHGYLGSSDIPDSSDPTYLQTVSVKSENKQQVFDGFGTSLAWWPKSIEGWDRSKRREVVGLVFGSDNLNFNIVRYNIGGGENPSHDHMVENWEMEGYKPRENEGYDWSRDNYQRTVLKGAIDRGADKLIAFSNSPPYWMTRSGCASGSLLGYTNNLHPDYYDNFADYLVTVVEHFHENWGITFDALAPLNEPSNPWRKYGRQEGSHFTLEKQNLIIKKVGKELESRDLPIGVDAPEEYWMGSSLDSIYHPPEISSSESSFRYYDENAKSYISTIATHAYSASQNDRRALKDLARSYDKKLYQSEYDTGFSYSDEKNYLILGDEISKDINTLGANGWVIWQAAPNNVPMEGGPDWGLVLTNEHEDYNITKKYYAMSNYSRFIDPGSRILKSSKPNVVMAHDSKDNELVIVVVNDENYGYNYEYDVGEFLENGQVVSHRTSMEENLEKVSTIQISDGVFKATAEEKSITTYTISLDTGN